MGTGSGILWTQDAELEMQTLVLRWDLKTDSIVSLRRAAEGRAHMQVQPSDVRAAWDAHQPKVFPRPSHGLLRACWARASRSRASRP